VKAANWNGQGANAQPRQDGKACSGRCPNGNDEDMCCGQEVSSFVQDVFAAAMIPND
jgi:hypothetical protein